ncbi:unnamed protein product [Cylicocyclus nassatus]|uniref:Glutaredoxin domain-containing protein n=1 Tax=Cylicocyclus nassatus TaxID=53992 RepID=A0AA36H2D6_CYLNA|nr:unnamed protein product [Cylicocyclus nassatus]
MGSSSSTPVLSTESQEVKAEVAKHPVVVYTKNYCPYCTKAKNELKQDGVTYVEKDLSDASQNAHTKGLMELTHCKTVPQIFVCGKFIGGYAEMHARRKDLLGMIKECSTDGRIVDRTLSDSEKSKI